MQSRIDNKKVFPESRSSTNLQFYSQKAPNRKFLGKTLEVTADDSFSLLEEGIASHVPNTYQKIQLNLKRIILNPDLEKTLVMRLSDRKNKMEIIKQIKEKKAKILALQRNDSLEKSTAIGECVSPSLDLGLFNAVSKGDVKLCMACVKKWYIFKAKMCRSAKDVVKAKDSHGRTALYVAAMHNKGKVVELLLKLGADPNITQSDNGQTPLHFALQAGNTALAKLLIKYKSDLNIKDSQGNTPVHYAFQSATHSDFLRFLQARKGYKEALKIKNNKGLTPARSRPISVQGWYKAADIETPKVDLCTAITETSEGSVPSCIYPDKHTNQLDSYTILKLLGKGSFGEVYLVEHKQTHVKCALKVIPKAKIIYQNLLRYIMSEKNVMASNNHPFIVKLHAAFQTRSYLFLVMDYCPGGDLSQSLAKEKQFSEVKAKLYLCEIVLAIEDLHRRKIIFR